MQSAPGNGPGVERRLEPRRRGASVKRLLLIGLFFFASGAPAAAQSLGLLSTGGKGGPTLSAPMQIAVGLTLLTLLPAVVMSITPFLRIVVVLHFLRQALGTQSTPSNQVMLGLAMFLTILIMQPIAQEIYHAGWEPVTDGRLTPAQGFEEGVKPLKGFLVRFAREKDIRLFVELSKTPAPRTPADLGIQVLIPAYILSELKTGFQIGAVLFLPFLVIDLVVASVTLSIGMVQLPPVMLSAPFKILLFVLVDGWTLVVGSLMKSFYQ
ncbi:MAG: flagellar type III secretion system pore protein FliP [Candidatus Solibacter usitatus]|nr:flagellar type III secretion system pore protein FliP [Candidatus Solibacter usitatus]